MGDTWDRILTTPCETVLDIFMTHTSIRSSLGRPGLDVSQISRLARNFDQPVLLKTGLSAGLMMDNRHRVLITTVFSLDSSAEHVVMYIEVTMSFVETMFGHHGWQINCLGLRFVYPAHQIDTNFLLLNYARICPLS